MSVYRITRLKALDLRQIRQIMETMQNTIASMGADFVDVAEGDDDTVVIVARYPTTSVMEAATAIAQGAFGEMVTRGAVDSRSIDQWVGHVAMSF
jgi:uncharacterized protein (DUF1330 family)